MHDFFEKVLPAARGKIPSSRQTPESSGWLGMMSCRLIYNNVWTGDEAMSGKRENAALPLALRRRTTSTTPTRCFTVPLPEPLREVSADRFPAPAIDQELETVPRAAPARRRGYLLHLPSLHAAHVLTGGSNRSKWRPPEQQRWTAYMAQAPRERGRRGLGPRSRVKNPAVMIAIGDGNTGRFYDAEISFPMVIPPTDRGLPSIGPASSRRQHPLL
jgi:hypothetical protein